MLNELMFGIDITELVGNVFYVMVAFILFDVVTGLLASAKNGKLNSSVNFDGLIRKMGELVGIVFLTFIDIYFDTNGKIATTGLYLMIVYEGISILENFKRIGVNFKFLYKYFDKDKYKGDKHE